ncbi:MAG: type II toxin-antitoxin system VapC family toxin [Rectinema sp.]|nr:type II toxin-antitoxin system VapC family toxin [Rectinema sp.]
MTAETKKQPRFLDFRAPPPAFAYLDPSFLLNVLVSGASYHSECVAYAHRLEAAKTTLVLSNLGLEEIWFVLLRIQATEEHGEKGWLTFLRENPAKVSAYTPRLEEATAQILEIPRLLLVELSASQSLRALALMKRAGLLPRDALHATTALEIGLDAIITTDADFAQVEDLTIYTCNSALLQRQTT